MARADAEKRKPDAKRAGAVRVGLWLAVVASLVVPPAVALPAEASSSASVLPPSSLVQARKIRRQLDARYRAVPRRGLAVTEASSTAVIESFSLLPTDRIEPRILPAANGVWYAICPVRATCPYPARRLARPAADVLPRRLALELALRTFLETPADLVAVSLPTRDYFTAFVVEREELAQEGDLRTLATALGGSPKRPRPLSASLRAMVERVTRPRVWVFVGLEPTASGRTSWAGLPRWSS
jgi:hypothetical protein